MVSLVVFGCMDTQRRPWLELAWPCGAEGDGRQRIGNCHWDERRSFPVEMGACCGCNSASNLVSNSGGWTRSQIHQVWGQRCLEDAEFGFFYFCLDLNDDGDLGRNV